MLRLPRSTQFNGVRSLALIGSGLLAAQFALPVQASEWSGQATIESTVFGQDALDSRQHGNNLSVSAQPELVHEWDNANQSIVVVPFARIDQHDDERTHADIRELTWLKVAETWELRLGIRKVFWGKTESQHLVDIINQTDAIESTDGEDKLGQPMVNLALIRDWGTVDLFVLPGFRERTFPGIDGRLRTPLPVDTSQTGYESSREDRHIDLALRWSHYIDEWDFGLSYFTGTSRSPELIQGTDGQGNSVLTPYYEIINQAGLDLQTIQGDWLWKLELISRDVNAGRYNALTGGFEYTFVGVADTSIDVGLISEYLYDDRGQQATTPFANDLLMATRLTLNDEQSSELLAGIIYDLDHNTRMVNVEASRRIGDSWKLGIELRTFGDPAKTELLYGLRNDDFLKAELAWYF